MANSTNKETFHVCAIRYMPLALLFCDAKHARRRISVNLEHFARAGIDMDLAVSFFASISSTSYIARPSSFSQFGLHRLAVAHARFGRAYHVNEGKVRLRISSFLLSCAQPPAMSRDPLRPANIQIVDFIKCLLLFDGCY